MSYFFDTNVCIGYVFSWDPWHDSSSTVFLEGKNLYWSDRVKKESKNKYRTFIRKYRTFIHKFISTIKNKTREELNKGECISEIEIVCPNDDYIQHLKNWVKNIWSNYNLNDYNEPKNKIINILNQVRLSFGDISNTRKSKFERFVMEKNRDVEYPEIKQALHLKAIQNDYSIHIPDDLILLDAHHLCVNEIPDLEFVTSDKEFCKCAKGETAMGDNISYLKEF